MKYSSLLFWSFWNLLFGILAINFMDSQVNSVLGHITLIISGALFYKFLILTYLNTKIDIDKILGKK